MQAIPNPIIHFLCRNEIKAWGWYKNAKVETARSNNFETLLI